MESIEAILQINKGFKNRINQIKTAKKSDLLKFLNKFRKETYEKLNEILPHYLELNTTNHDYIIKHMSELKRQYAKDNLVEDVESNLFKISIMIGLLYFFMDKEIRKVWLKKITNSLKHLKHLIKKSMSNIVKLNVEKFFKEFYKFMKNVFLVTISTEVFKGNFLNDALSVLMYLVVVLFSLEITCLIKILFINAFETI